MAWTPAQLKTAIAALSPMPSDAQGKADALNAQSVQGSVPASFDITGAQLMRCLVLADFSALTAPQQTQVLNLCAQPVLPVGTASTFVQPYLASLFGAGTTTRANLLALAHSITSSVWQPPVTAGDVQTAMAQP